MELGKTIDMQNAIREILNKASRENESNTPDYILAQYLMNCLEAFENAIIQREQHWPE